MSDGTYPTVGQLMPGITLGLATFGDLTRWVHKEFPGYEYLPAAASAFGEMTISPWVSPEQARLPARMVLWAFAIDDVVEKEITELDELEDLFDRCNAVVRTGRRDDSHPILASLSGWQQELAQLPNYPALSALWERKFAACLAGHRYDWIAGWARTRGTTAPGFTMDVAEYLAHHDGAGVGQVHVPRWIVYGGDDVSSCLDVLVPALEDASVLIRLANDLGTFARERDEPGQNNVLMYDVSEDWVRDQITSRFGAVNSRLEPLLAEGYAPAVGIIRLIEWAIGIYLDDHPRFGGEVFLHSAASPKPKTVG